MAATSDKQMFGNKCLVLVSMSSAQDVSGENAIDEYDNAAPRERTRLQITYRPEIQLL